MMQQMFLGLGGVSEKYWIITLGGSGNDYGNGIAHDASGNVYATGYGNSDGPGGNDLIVSKYDKDGNQLWDKALGTNTAYRNDDNGRMVAVDSSGNVYVVGTTNLLGPDSMMIAKYNSSGVHQWDKTFGDTSTDNKGYGICVDSSDNILVCGSSNKGTSGTGAILLKINSSGAEQWQKTLDGTQTQLVYDVSVDSSDNIYIGGYTTISGYPYSLLAKYNSSGTLQWNKKIGGSTTSDYGRSVTVDSSDNIYVGGVSTGGGVGVYDSYLVKYNSSGTYQWQKALGTSGQQISIWGMTSDSSDNVYVAGAYSSSYFFAKYDSDGNLEWQRSLGGSGSDVAYSISADTKGNIYVMGVTSSSGAGSNDFMFAKLPSDGTKTGTYGSFTYAASSHNQSTPTHTSSNAGHTANDENVALNEVSFSDEEVSLTSTKIDVD